MKETDKHKLLYLNWNSPDQGQVSQSRGTTLLINHVFELGEYCSQSGIGIREIEQVDWWVTRIAIDRFDEAAYLGLKLKYGHLFEHDWMPSITPPPYKQPIHPPVAPSVPCVSNTRPAISSRVRKRLSAMAATLRGLCGRA